MDHGKSYAFHIAQAIRHKKQMKQDPEPSLQVEEEFELSEQDIPEEPSDPKEARRERIKAILSR